MKSLFIAAATALMMTASGAAFAQDNNVISNDKDDNNLTQSGPLRTEQENCQEAQNSAETGNLTFKCGEAAQAPSNGVDATGSTSAPIVDGDEGDQSGAKNR